MKQYAPAFIIAFIISLVLFFIQNRYNKNKPHPGYTNSMVNSFSELVKNYNQSNYIKIDTAISNELNKVIETTKKDTLLVFRINNNNILDSPDYILELISIYHFLNNNVHVLINQQNQRVIRIFENKYNIKVTCLSEQEHQLPLEKDNKYYIFTYSKDNKAGNFFIPNDYLTYYNTSVINEFLQYK